MAEAGGLRSGNLLFFIDDICSLVDSHTLPQITDLLASNKMIPLDVREALECMHESVPHPTKCRYLIWSVYNTIGELDCGLDKFTKLLSEMPLGRKMAYNYYKKQHWYGKASKMILKLKKATWYEILIKMFCDVSDKDLHSISNAQQSEVFCVDERDEVFFVLLEVKMSAPSLLRNSCQWNRL